MASIMTPPIRKMIKAALAVKYIDSCGIKMPTMPSIPEFTLPPMPDMSYIENELSNIQAAASSMNNNSIYTNEYLEASKLYNELVNEAKTKYQNETDKINKELLSLSKEIYDYKITQKRISLESEKNQAKTDLDNSLKEAREKSNIDNVVKFKRIAQKEKDNANEIAEKEIEKLKNSESQEAMVLLKEILLNQYQEWADKEKEKAQRLKEEAVKAYEDTASLFKQVQQEAHDYFEGGGAGDNFVEDKCDEIDNIFDNFTESFKELVVDISTMIAKIPNPDVIVAGAAVGIPNPAQKVMIFMENMKKVLTDIKKIINYIKEIIAIAKMLYFAISDLIPAFKNLCVDFESKQKAADDGFKQAVKAIRKRQKWYLEHQKPKTANETKLAGYMYADVSVDWVNHEIEVKGYKCYCRKDYGRTYVENGTIKKSYWIGGYRKNQGPYVDSSGNHYYYLTKDEIAGQSEYDEQEIIDDILADSEETGYEISDYDVDLGTNYDSTTGMTKLNLSDGRTITIDYLAASGDVIRLNDGTIIRVQ